MYFLKTLLYNIIEKAEKYWDNKTIGGCQGLGGERDEKVEHTGFLGQWHYSVWCNCGYMTLHICQNP